MDRFSGLWVQAMLARARKERLTTDAVYQRMEADIGHGPLAIGRTKNVLGYIDGMLSSQRGSELMRGLRVAAVGYLERERGRLKAA